MYRILIRQITYHMICNYTLHTTQFHRFTLCTEKHNITITVIIIIIRFISNKFNRINLMFLLVVILFVHFEGINGGGKAPNTMLLVVDILPRQHLITLGDMDKSRSQWRRSIYQILL
ncbi:unnamed protein product [Schistosoma haematobium]|nr:unnamed protein product [Schistosoma haematobium]